MKTKVIISGGYADLPNELNDKFFSEILREAPDKVTILLILFAKERYKWNKKAKGVIKQFERVNSVKNIKFVLATHDYLEDQVQSADIVYIRGGETPRLLKGMNKHPRFKELLKGKTIAAESAGTYLLSECFYSKTAGGVYRGLGILPIKSICHFSGENENQLDECPSSLEKVLLKDFESKVYYI